MLGEEVFMNVLLISFCYVYILFIIFVSSKMSTLLHISKKASRKFLHAMIGNLPFIIPFFTSDIYPVLVAAPLILVTFFTSPYSLSRALVPFSIIVFRKVFDPKRESFSCSLQVNI